MLALDLVEPSESAGEPGKSRAALRMLVALPALNEERTVGAIIRAIPRSIPGVGEIEVVVVDDGSQDATASEARAAGARVIRHSVCQGVGAAFHSALAYGIHSGAELIVTIDSDGQFDPRDIPRLVEPILVGAADFTTASRFKNRELSPRMPWLKRAGNWLMSRLISSLTGQRFYDVSCGMRCYSRRAALRLDLLGQFTYTQEVFLNLAFKKMRIAEVPIRVRGEREFGESRVANNLWSYGSKTLKIILRAYRDYRPLRFFGSAAAIFLGGSVGLGGFFIWHYLQAGTFSPHLWAGFSAAALLGLALLAFHAGMIGDILNRHRVYLEELLYEQRLGRTDVKALERPDKCLRR